MTKAITRRSARDAAGSIRRKQRGYDPMISMDVIMQAAVDRNASDIHLKVHNPPILRIDGRLIRLPEYPELTDDLLRQLLSEITTDKDRIKFEKLLELDTSVMYGNIARFRVNVCLDDGHPRIVMRLIPLRIKTVEELGLPLVLKNLCKLKNGLVLFTGPTGSGKSTSLAAMIDEINRTRPDHIVTVEDPLEFIHEDKMGVVTHREVGHDTLSFANALRGALRQDPDVILIGEMRDVETVRTAMAAAETGHLVFSTLHTVDAVETLNRIMEFFEPHQHVQIRKQLAGILRCICSQRILPLAQGKGRVVACEVLIGTRTVRDFMEQGKPFREIVGLIEDGRDQWGMQTFDQALFDLWKSGKITAEVALQNASSAKDLKLRMQGMAVR
ncbi:MAG TPA: PilT/PilU family type 4a pilus ATPase [Candidatus Hydrogenedentes bacterium]|nr:PilT/PilU family type 4a pilus ATPase [Candidatus Hydrogenedentota bacterium]HOK90766.1 PilT/PilU family type 4a pilus ATPase [Candidatus Hydrogenedentota bacterium]HPO30123.1 PilT/PilU family type 4a pilus ATPase [Candidatus Hydrogenedentota bacterium]